MLPHWDPFVVAYAAAYKIPYSLVRGLIVVESTERVDARSSAGALGLCQVMPMHFSRGQDPFDPEVNIATACRILAECFNRLGSWEKTLAAYNGSLSRYGYILDPSYVISVFSAQQTFA